MRHSIVRSLKYPQENMKIPKKNFLVSKRVNKIQVNLLKPQIINLLKSKTG